MPRSSPHSAARRAQHRGGLIAATAVFLLLIAGGTLPIPLYRLWAPMLHFGPFTTVLLFVGYAVGVVVTLLVGGRASDTAGRRPVMAIALIAAILSTVLFIVGGSVIVLLIARLLSGVAAGAAVPAATAWIGELSGGSRTAAATLAGIANFGGFAIGTIGAGVLVQATGSIPAVFATYLVVLLGLAAITWRLRETVPQRSDALPRLARPALPPPGRARRAFAGATLVAAAGFAINGAFSSLVPQFLQTGLGITGPAAGSALVALIFLTALAAQLLMPAVLNRRPLVIAALVAAGAIGVQIALAATAVQLFVLATLVAGTGIGWAVRRGLLVTDRVAAPDRRAELNASYYLGTYSGLIVPTVLLGVLQQTVGEPVSTLVFTALVLVVVAIGAVLSATAPLVQEQESTS